MIDLNFSVHDRFSVELKLGFAARKKKEISDFACNTWIFLPGSLDVNASTFSKNDFYRDIKTNIRLITPKFLLRNLADATKPPFTNLSEAFAQLASSPTRTKGSNFEYQIRMFLSILKSALREEIKHIVTNTLQDDTHFLIESYADSLTRVTEIYRELRRIINASTVSKQQLNYYLFGDEFMSNLIEQHTFKLLDQIKDRNDVKQQSTDRLFEVIHREITYKKEKKLLTVEKNSPDRNRELVFRLGLLKKYAENELFLTANTKKDGAIAEQVYYSLAAGFSMIFATAIAFSVQQRYGNFTMPLFVALVISYMLKDRIKDLSRYYFAHKLGRRHFDHKTRISLNENEIGWSKEAMDFISDDKLPPEVIKIRDRSAILEANNRSNSEKIILYRKLVRLNRKELDKSSQYSHNGVNEIIRINFSAFINKMDDPVVPLYAPLSYQQYEVVKGEKIYYINLIIQLKSEDQLSYKRFRIAINRKGIRGVETFD